MSTAKSTPRETLNVRVRPEVRGLIDRAAAARGTTRTDFILDAATRAAEETLLERAFLAVDRGAYDRFVKLLDAPAKPNARLRKTMRAPLPWKAG